MSSCKSTKKREKGHVDHGGTAPATSSQKLSSQKQTVSQKKRGKKLAMKPSKAIDTPKDDSPTVEPVSRLPDPNTVSMWRYKDFFALVKAFVDDSEAQELSLPSSLSGNQRKDVHTIAAIFELAHKSYGSSTNRALKLTKLTAESPLQTQDGTVDGSLIKKSEGFQGAQELKNCPNEDQLKASIDLMMPYWQSMRQGLRHVTAHFQVRRKPMHMLQGGLSAPPLSKMSSLRHKSLQKERRALPVFARHDEIVNAVIDNDVIIICGATGCGKTTQVPQMLYDAHIFPENSFIVCTQPRRISAISVACRVAEERGEECGGTCGYLIRFENKTSSDTRIVYETTGIFLRQLHTEPELNQVACVIVDEVHERDVETDFCLLLLRDRLIAQRKDPDRYPTMLKLVVMSATMKIESLMGYFSEVNTNPQIPIVDIEGTLFPVDEYFLEDAIQWAGMPATSVPAMGLLRNNTNPEAGDEENCSEEQGLYEKLRSSVFNDIERDAELLVPYELICKLISYFHVRDHNCSKGILVFLPGWAAIMRVRNMLDNLPIFRELYVLMLHSSLTGSEQQRVFLPAPKKRRKVVLATSIAETSITIDNIVYVIDSGLIKGTLYDPSNNLVSLKARLIAKANGKQRRGRAGRCQAGVCVHLLPTAVYNGLQDFLPPEMMRSPLEEVCLQLKAIHPTERCEVMLVRAMDPPPVTSVKHAVQFLTEMGALTVDNETMTNLGHALAQLPVHPLLGKMLFAATCFGVLDSVATIAAGLSMKTLFVKPQASDKMEAQRAMRRLDEYNFSDHLCVLKVYREWQKSGQSSHYACENFADQSALYMLDRTKQQLLGLILRSPLLRRMKNPIHDASQNDGNTGLVRLVLLWSLYPRIASFEFQTKRKTQPPKVVCWDNKPSAFCMPSVLASIKKQDIESRPFVMYYNRMQLESSLMLFDSSCVSPLDVALCVNQLKVCPLSDVPNSVLLDKGSKMEPLSPFNPANLENKENYMALFFDEGKKLYVTTKHVARALKLARNCMDYYLSLSIKKLRADIFPKQLVRAIATLIGYPLSKVKTRIKSFKNVPGAVPTFTNDNPKSVPSFIRGHKDIDSPSREDEANMIEVVCEDEIGEPLALTVDQKKLITDTFGNLTVLRDNEISSFLTLAQVGHSPKDDNLVSDAEASVMSPNTQHLSREECEADEEEEEDIIIAKPGELVFM